MILKKKIQQTGHIEEECSRDSSTREHIPILRLSFNGLCYLLLFSLQKNQERKKTD